MAPTWGVAGTQLTAGSSTTAAVPVPAGVVAGSVILVWMYVETTQAVTPPAGFAEAPSSPVVVTGASAHDEHVFWKRATAADSGTYSFTIAAGLAWRFAIAARFDGCVTAGSPFDVTTSAIKTTNADKLSPAVTATSTGADRLFVWSATSFVTNTSTAPATTTERIDVTDQACITVATKPQAVAGSSGSLQGTFNANTASASWLGALLPVNTSGFFGML